jgi:hypothetical protein
MFMIVMMTYVTIVIDRIMLGMLRLRIANVYAIVVFPCHEWLYVCSLYDPAICLRSCYMLLIDIMFIKHVS